jgi:hypothetical protein
MPVAKSQVPRDEIRREISRDAVRASPAPAGAGNPAGRGPRPTNGATTHRNEAGARRTARCRRRRLLRAAMNEAAVGQGQGCLLASTPSGGTGAPSPKQRPVLHTRRVAAVVSAAAIVTAFGAMQKPDVVPCRRVRH